MKKLLVIAGVIILSISVVRCGSSSSGGAERLTTAGKMSSGLGSSVTTIQSIGGAMGSNGTFALNQRNVNSLSAATKCTIHADPGTDSNLDGVVSDSERYSTSDVHYTLQKFYCTLAADINGPEAVSGSVRLIKTIVCAVEKQIGTLAFNNVVTPITGITLDSTCATQSQIDSMSGTTGQSSVVITIPGGGTVTSTLNPTFAEIPGNTFYSHGIKIVSNDGTSLKFIVVAKFNPAIVGNPVESGNFEFATLGTGTMMQGTAIEYTAGKISGGSATTKHLWYEARSNRIKTSNSDAICPGTSGSCGFARHTRLSTDISFAGGDINDVSNLYGIISDSGDLTGLSGQTSHMSVITAQGNLSTGIYGQYWSNSSAPMTLTSVSTLSALTAGTPTCIMSAGSSVTASCGGSPPILAPTGAIQSFLTPANTTTWFSNASTKAGIGFTGATTFADGQFVNP